MRGLGHAVARRVDREPEGREGLDGAGELVTEVGRHGAGLRVEDGPEVHADVLRGQTPQRDAGGGDDLGGVEVRGALVATDADDLAGAIHAVAREVDHRVGDQLRVEHVRIDVHRLEDALGHAGVRHRGDGVDLHVGTAALEGQGLGEAHDAQLGAGVVGLTPVAEQPGGRGGVDDAPVAGLVHVLVGGVRHQHGADEVHVDDVDDLLRRHVGEVVVTDDAGVVDHDVDATELGDDGVHQVLDVHVLADVALDEEGGAAVDLDLFGEVRGIGEVEEHDDGAALGELQGVRPAEAVGRAGDQDDSLVERDGIERGAHCFLLSRGFFTP